MKFLSFFISILLLPILNCRSIQKYSYNRIRDTSDIITIGLEKKNIGVTAFLWCIGGGLSLDHNPRGIGLREGHFGIYEIEDGSKIGLYPLIPRDSRYNKMGITNILINSSGHYPFRPEERSQNKTYQVLNLLTIFPILANSDATEKVGSCNAPFKFEGSLGLYYGIRFGFNFYELLDFVVGFSSVDLLHDDE